MVAEARQILELLFTARGGLSPRQIADELFGGDVMEYYRHSPGLQASGLICHGDGCQPRVHITEAGKAAFHLSCRQHE